MHIHAVFSDHDTHDHLQIPFARIIQKIRRNLPLLSGDWSPNMHSFLTFRFLTFKNAAFAAVAAAAYTTNEK